MNEILAIIERVFGSEIQVLGFLAIIIYLIVSGILRLQEAIQGILSKKAMAHRFFIFTANKYKNCILSRQPFHRPDVLKYNK